MTWQQIAAIVAAVGGLVALVVAATRTSDYLDRRTSFTPEDVQIDLERYGPDALGLKRELLPPDPADPAPRTEAQASGEDDSDGSGPPSTVTEGSGN